VPTYEYVCAKCGHEFEKMQRISDPALTTCPKELCAQKKWGRGRVKRMVVAGAGLLFKGSGFYITDYRSEGYKSAAKKDSASAGGETKPASTPAPSGGTTPTAAPAKTEAKPAKTAKKE
jgi:putative FmdB family regulatory protein